MGWDFTKLPKEEHNKAIEALGKIDYSTMFIMMIKYKLTTYDYCCEGEYLYYFFKDAIDRGIIKNN